MARKDFRDMRIGVLMGGTSSERDVSLKSGTAICHALTSLNYKVISVDVKGDICSVLRRSKIDVAFIALHGGQGENGAIQGMLEVLNVPYTGSGVLASALAMDKELSKKIFIYHGIPVPPFRIIGKSEFSKKSYTFKPGFKLPWVVKPVSEGSSVGVEIVKKRDRFRKSVRQAFFYGDKVMVEKYIAGKEIQIGILNDSVMGGVEVRPSLEFYNYEAKYTSGLTEYILPPLLKKRVYERSKRAALAAHRALTCSGATRVDLRVDERGNPFVLEVNTIPGMTETSLLPKIARQAGLDFPALLLRILEGIYER